MLPWNTGNKCKHVHAACLAVMKSFISDPNVHAFLKQPGNCDKLTCWLAIKEKNLRSILFLNNDDTEWSRKGEFILGNVQRL